MATTDPMRGVLANRIARSFLSFLGRKSPGRPALLDRVLQTYDKRSVWYFQGLYLLIDIICKRLNLSRETLVREFISNPPVRVALVNACRSLGKYGPTSPQVFAAPVLVVWNFTNRCNLRCKHCYQDAGKPLSDELTLEEQFHVVDELAENGVSILAFSGGEPLMSPTFWEVARYADKRGIWTSLATNGTMITKEVAQRLKEVGVSYVEVSLDSASPQKHDAFRGVPGYWQRAVEGIKNAVQVGGLRVGVAPTVTARNIDELEQLFLMSRDLGAKNFCAFNFVPTGRGKGIAADDLSVEQREMMMDVLYRYLPSKGMIVMSTCPQFGRFCLEKDPEGPMATSHFSSAPGSSARLLAEYVGGCGCGRAYCAIQPNGVVTPCVFLPLPVGDLRKQRLADIWDHSPVLQQLRDRNNLKEHCGRCDYREVCGGCRARAYGYFGDYNAPDPGCKFNGRARRQLEAEALASAV